MSKSFIVVVEIFDGKHKNVLYKMFYLVSYRGDLQWTESRAQIRLFDWKQLESEHVSPPNLKLPPVKGDLSSFWCQFRGEQFHCTFEGFEK